MNDNLQPKHTVTMQDRSRLSVGGVTDVISFDEQSIVFSTSLGEMYIEGEGLHITSLSIEKAHAEIDGKVDSISYLDENRKEKKRFSFFGGK